MATKTTRTVPRSLAVLPFTDDSPAHDQAYFCDGLAGEIGVALGRVRGLTVSPAAAVSRLMEGEREPAAIGRALSVRAVLEGTARRSGDRMWISVRLVDANGKRLWSREFDRPAADVFTVQQDIVNAVARKLGAKAAAKPARKRAAAPESVEDLEAYDLYLQGRVQGSTRTGDGLRLAIGSFEQSILISANYAPAYSGLADSWTMLAIYDLADPNKVIAIAREAAQKAVALDESLAEAHTSLGLLQATYDWDWNGAKQSFQRALKLDPRHAPARQAMANYCLTPFGKLNDADEALQRALAIDPGSTPIQLSAAIVHYFRRDYENAIAIYRGIERQNPMLPAVQYFLARAHACQGNWAEAEAAFEKFRELSQDDPRSLAGLAYVHARRDEPERAEETIQELKRISRYRYVSPMSFALIYCGLGDTDRAFELLDQAAVQRCPALIWLKVDPEWESLASDERFGDLLNRMGLTGAPKPKRKSAGAEEPIHSGHAVARNLYEQGRIEANRRTEKDLRSSIGRFRDAIALSPGFAAAYSGVADSWTMLAMYGFLAPGEAMAEARTAALKALEMDAGAAEGHVALGTILATFDWDWTGAEEQLKLAVKGNPHSAAAHQAYAMYSLAPTGKVDEAAKQMARALALNPESATIQASAGVAEYFRGRFDAAIEHYQKSLDLRFKPLLIYYFLGRACALSGRFDDARSCFEAWHAGAPDDLRVLALLAWIDALAGRREAAEELLGELQKIAATQYFPAVDLALVHTALGNRDAAFEWLAKAVEERCPTLIWLHVDPEWSGLREDGRFQDLIRTLGLAD